MSQLGLDTAELITLLQSNWTNNCTAIATCALVFYDHATTISREVDYIWGRKLNSVTLLFHLNRWTLFAWAISEALDFMSQNTIPRCVGFSMLDYILNILLFAIWALFSAVRTYAISGGSWWLSVLVLCLNLVPLVTSALSYFEKTTYQMVSVPVLGLQCLISADTSQSRQIQFTAASRTCVITSDVIVLVITWVKTFKIKREAVRNNVSVPLVSMLLRDGTTYFIALLTLNILSITGIITNVFTETVNIFVVPYGLLLVTTP
ncbi:hypothetical protein CERSUDRAFT_81028 [Gelatoporia subvermispora B]|uniref:DUF6533 domain-containing protein n=1 Tax=Ceriporiopsis subvermispora (strain B) TaxID=914234 RepID=M2RLD1_CERS8|nr:hypothetical protein CERSUDRAFT_81028 [Gelatoporia subvermispora B]